VTTWRDLVESSPELASRVEALFARHKHHTMATVRQDGSPRISGTEVQFAEGQLCFAMMSGARRGWDLRRDARVAIHSQGIDPPDHDPQAWPGEAKIAGMAIEVDPSAEPGGSFRSTSPMWCSPTSTVSSSSTTGTPPVALFAIRVDGGGGDRMEQETPDHFVIS
jgi:hypothetical protein